MKKLRIKVDKTTFRISYIVPVLLAALLLRLILHKTGTLKLDFNTFIAWSTRLNEVGFSHFYDNWSDYLPGYLYILWFLGWVKNIFPFGDILLYKSPAIMADLVTGYVIYKIVKKIKNERLALISSSFYLFNPAVIANSTMWGQVDAFTALFSLLAIWLVDINFITSAIILAFGTVVKPQAALAALVVLFVMLKSKWKIEKIVLYVFTSFFTFVMLFVPFSGGVNNLPVFVMERVETTLNQYVYTSVNAFSAWGLVGFWQEDTFGTQLIGYLLVLAFSLLAAKKLWKMKGGRYMLMAVVFASGFLFSTRMHERHLMPALAPMAISAALEPVIWVAYLGFSVTYLVNLRYSFVWIVDNFREIVSPIVAKLLIFLNLAFFFVLFAASVSNKKLLNTSKELSRSLHNIKHKQFKPNKELFGKRTARYLLLVILLFSLISRLISLTSPGEEYFDEVYHAFTARRMLNGDPKAWEWWNPHPEGYAYEWTHPPLAKEGMVLGMLVFGENPLGWRIVGTLLGVGSVFMVYIIARDLFISESVGVLSAGVFALDGLPLVMSRIAMNDSYILFFALLSIYLFMKDKFIFSALAFGLALSSKWSALWVLPIFVAFYFALNKKYKPAMLSFLVIPPLVYVATYIPMFLTGHGFDIFTGVQKQMWWYHTNLDATHPFTSPWWSWPLLKRPIWLYTSGEVGSKVSNIYTMGNPVIFWSGFAAVLTSLYVSILERNKKLGLIVFSYFVLFAPWALSPRIMFLYHYLPSIPFLAIGLGYVLTRFIKNNLVVGFFTLALVSYVYFFPRLTGFPIPTSLDESYHWFKTW